MHPGSFEAQSGKGPEDWLLLPIKDHGYVQRWAKKRDEHEARQVEASKSADK